MLASLWGEHMNCDLANVCGGVFPPIGGGGLKVIFSAKCKGWVHPVTSLGIEFQSFCGCCTADLEGLVIVKSLYLVGD